MKTDEKIVEELLPSERDLERAGKHYWGGDYEPSYQEIINLKESYREAMFDRLLTTLKEVREAERKRFIDVLEDSLEEEYLKRNPPNQHNQLDDFRFDVHKAIIKELTPPNN